MSLVSIMYLLRRLDGWMTIKGSTSVYKWDDGSSTLLTSEAFRIMACDWILLVAWSEKKTLWCKPVDFFSSSSSFVFPFLFRLFLLPPLRPYHADKSVKKC